MLSTVLDPQTGLLRERALWLVLAAVILSQLLAFYLLCNGQVLRAEERRAASGVQPMGVECQQARHVPGCRPAQRSVDAQVDRDSTVAFR